APTETKAVKEHRCSFCNERIMKGEKYMKSTHIFDGRVYDWKSHKHCSKLADRLHMYSDCDEGVTQEDFIEIVSNVHDDILINMLPKEVEKYGDIIQQLRKVNFKDKLWYVVRYYNKLMK
ncbi:MAG TPA: hypothetical protein VFM79_09010, partial [Pelobium sp.]|nr:hypothetical protein [Pelobium sp.]